MTAKEYLNQAFELKRDIHRKQNQIAVLQAMAERATSTYQALRTSGTSKRSKLESAVDDMADIQTALAGQIEGFKAKYREIAGAIEKVEDPVYRETLTLRYLCFLTWDEIADQMKYTVRWTHILHGRALKEVKEFIVVHY